MKNLILTAIVMVTMALSACTHKNSVTGGGSDKDYCDQNPSNCAMKAN